MKVWEVFKELTEHPEKVFVNGNKTFYCGANRYVIFERAGEFYGFNGNVFLDDDGWEEEIKPVSWMEAMNSHREFKPEEGVWEYDTLDGWITMFWSLPTYQTKELMNKLWVIKK